MERNQAWTAVVPDPVHPHDGDELEHGDNNGHQVEHKLAALGEAGQPQEEAGGPHQARNVGLVVPEVGFQFHTFCVLFFNFTCVKEKRKKKRRWLSSKANCESNLRRNSIEKNIMDQNCRAGS